MENKPQSNVPVTQKRSTLAYIWKHKLEFFLLLLLVIVLCWALINNISLKHNFKKEKQELTSKYMGETSKIFSWAIRGELLRDNREQVNQFFMSLIKEPGFKRIQLVDAGNSKIIISTNKKDEGTLVSDTLITNANAQRQEINDGIIKSITPIMGLNSRIGILVIEREY
jgi:hypothetical protein